MESLSPSRRQILAALTALSIPAPTGAAAPTPAAQARVPVTDWGVVGNNDPGDTERIQRAFDAAPIGADLFFPPGSYRIRAQLNLRRRINIVGHDALITGDFGRNTGADLLAINIEDPGNRDNRNQRIEGLRIGFVSGGRNAIAVYNRAPNIANIGMLIQNSVIGVLPQSAGHAIRLEGIGTHFVTIRDCQIENGIYLACADGIIVEGCLIFGHKPAVTTDLIPGAFQTRIVRNGLVARDGALQVLRGSQIHFEQNTVEQFPVYGRNQSRFGASVTIAPREYGSRHIRIVGNNFGAGANADTSIHVTGDCQDLFIDGNVFNVASSDQDVRLADAAVAWTRIGPNNSLRGPAARRRHLAAGDPLSILDRGTGTFGVRKGAESLGALQAGWAASPDFRFGKNLDGELRFEGSWRAGTLAPGTLVARLPHGFRPRSRTVASLANEASAEPTLFALEPDGTIRVLRGQPGPVSWNGVIVPAASRDAYGSGDP